MIYLTSDFIRALAGLSQAELPDEVIEVLEVIPIAEKAALNYSTLSDHEALYYKGYKALTLLGHSLILSVAQTVKDNFNQFTRFANAQEILSIAAAEVAKIEDPEGFSEYSIFEVVIPTKDPVTGETR